MIMPLKSTDFYDALILMSQRKTRDKLVIVLKKEMQLGNEFIDRGRMTSTCQVYV